MSATPFARRSRQGGQSVAECLVAAVFFVVPLFLAIVALGKFADVQHVATMAARYGAWERTVWYDNAGTDFTGINAPNQKTAGAIKGEIAARLFSTRTSAASTIRNTDGASAALVNGIDPMWRDARGAAFLSQYERFDAQAGRASPRRDIAGASVAAMAAVSVRGLAGFAPPLPADTLAVSTVSLTDIARESGVYARLWNGTPGSWQGLDFSATGAILSNTWGANGSSGTRDMVARSVPTAQGLGAVVRAAKAGIEPWDAVAASGIDVGRIDVDVVPDDRLR